MTAPPLADRPDALAARRDPASYRDPSGFVFRRDGTLYRQVNRVFAADWDAYLASGLHDDLVRRGLIVDHEPADPSSALDPEIAHVVIRPEPIDLVSYPYEWTFGELRDAALLTLEVQAAALAVGWTLKDATAYNVQFRAGRPILIDTLSFEPLEPGAPWIAYRQFCEHFLAPLALMAYRDVRCGLMLREFIDGIPLDLASTLLPGRTRLRFGILSHIHLHARAQRRYADTPVASGRNAPKVSSFRLAALVDSLRGAVSGLSWTPAGTEWAEYGETTSYTADAAREKERLVGELLDATGARRVWDLGANTGRFSAIAARGGGGREVIAFDIDPAAAERHYRTLRSAGEDRILPLVVDLANPSPRLGWALEERRSLLDRANADAVIALALVHHLAIGRNVPLGAIADLFADLAPQAIVEFVPKGDAMVTKLLASREDVFPDYTLDGFRAAVERRFEITAEAAIPGSERTLVQLRRRG
jgi:ribosomal protein L11 methylase PrmA